MKYLITVVLIITSLIVKGKGKDNDTIYYETTPVFSQKSGVVSITFDDGIWSQFYYGLPILNASKIPATFYIITNNIKPIKDYLIDLSKKKFHEIGSHTHTHSKLRYLADTSIIFELSKSKQIITDLCGPDQGLAISYPFGYFGKSTLKIAPIYYLSGRTGVDGFNNLIYNNPFELKTKIIDSTTSTSDVEKWIDYAVSNNKWLILTIHGIEKGYSPIKKDTFQRIVKLISTKNINASTVTNAIKYIHKFGSINLNFMNINDTSIFFNLDQDMIENILYQPFAIKIKLPAAWKDTINLFKDQKKYAFSSSIENSRQVLSFETTVDYSTYVIENPARVKIKVLSDSNLFNVIANNDVVSIVSRPYPLTRLLVQIVNIDGRVLYSNYFHSYDRPKLNINITNFKRGCYFVILNCDGGKIVKKFVKV